MKKVIISLTFALALVAQANAGIIRTAYRVVKYSPAVVKKASKLVYKVVV